MPSARPNKRKEIKAPVTREIHVSADELLLALLALEPLRQVQILDSGGARSPDARFLIAGFDPFEVIEARSDQLHIMRRDGANAEHTARGDAILGVLDDRLERYRAPRLPHTRHLPAIGACIATFSYDLARRCERLRLAAQSRLTDEPDAVLAFFDTLIMHDYWRSRTEIISVAGPERLAETDEALKQAGPVAEAIRPGKVKAKRFASSQCVAAPAPQPAIPPAAYLPHLIDEHIATSNFTRDEYLAAICRIKEHIAAGDIYQANLTQQLCVALDEQATPEQIFLRLRRDHPASFAAFLRRRDDLVISASPERFLRVEMDRGERRVEAWPIKGTRPRGRTAEEDARLRAELQASEKDRAENVMIVDLLRNDLGRVCKYGSVEVPELFTVQEHPTLFHLVSKVCGRLRDDVTAGDLLRAAFPCGSITGAPKIRAMEIIDEVEKTARGLSMGAIGYFSFDGSLDLNVAIRTMTLRDGRARFNVGGGIVADSDPALEYEESLVKAQALLRALDTSENEAEAHGKLLI